MPLNQRFCLHNQGSEKLLNGYLIPQIVDFKTGSIYKSLHCPGMLKKGLELVKDFEPKYRLQTEAGVKDR